MPTKEETYDNDIAPLVEKIIKICQENKIAMVASFSLSDDADGLACTTALLTDEYNPPAEFKKAIVEIAG